MRNCDLRLVRDQDDVADMFDWLESGSGPVGLDTETTGLDSGDRFFVRLIQIGDADNGWAVSPEWFGLACRELMSRVSRSHRPVVFWNAMFDLVALHSDGFILPEACNTHDAMIAHRLLHPASRHALKSVASEWFGPEVRDLERWLKARFKELKVGWRDVPVDEKAYWAYGALDPVLAVRCWERMSDDLPDAYGVEMAYLNVMFRASRRGMHVRSDKAWDLAVAWEAEAQDLEKILVTAGVRNPRSNQQIARVFKDAGWAPNDFTETGDPKVDKAVLNSLQKDPLLGDVAYTILRYRKLTKWATSYLWPFARAEGRVLPTISTMAARTGRSSISNPPLQQIPARDRTIRDLVVPGSGKSRLVSVDYSGQELRLLAAYAGEQSMQREFKYGSGDVHTLVATMLDVERSVAKTLNFALIYGAGLNKMAATIGSTTDEVSQFLNRYYAQFPKIKEFIEYIKNTAKQRYLDDGSAWVQTLGGRRVETHPDKVFRLVNYLIQGSGADVLKRATLRLTAAGLDEFIVVPVHDELLFDIPKNDVEQVIKEVVPLMEDEVAGVPLRVDVSKPGRTWGEIK